MVILDDIQTDKSAKNPARVDEQLSLLNGTLKGLAGVDQPLTMVAALTVIEADDLADRLIKSPSWRAAKFGVVDRLPSDAAIEKWARHNQLRAEAIADGLDDEEITVLVNEAFEADKDELIDGCKPTWEAFKDPHDINSMQKIMRLYFDDFNTFSREYMNDPSLAVTADSQQLTIEQLNEKITAYKRNSLPLEAEYLTAGCDSQTLGIFYTIMAHAADGTAWVIDYGKYPKSMKRTLTQQYEGIPLEQAIYAGYKDLLTDLLNRVYTRPDGLELKISRCVLDGSYGPTTADIERCIRDMQNPVLLPLFGRARTPDEKLFSDKKKPGELRGKGWLMPPVARVKDKNTGKMIIQPRRVYVDVNAWKSALRAGLQARAGTPGGITIFFDAAANHREYFLHLTSERSTTLTGKYGTIDMFKLLPNRANHWLDTTVYALAAGSMVQTGGSGKHLAPKIDAQFTRKRVKLSDIQNKRNS
ncbi:MAG: phage terminase large subunit family protein [Thermoguttaceae bacterium]|nr:phage terminase large subunit family protein [Thermoguttaceae bacterium]